MHPGSAQPSAHFTLLFDTNTFIALEPTSQRTEPGLRHAATLVRLAQAGGHRFYTSAGTATDIRRDHDPARRATNLQLLKKYESLAPINPPFDLLDRLGEEPPPPGRGSNDDVDLEMLAALWVNAVDFLVTNDEGLHRRGARAGLGERMLRVADAAVLLERFTATASVAPPAVEAVRNYQLDLSDPIFDSLRADYPDFDGWLRRSAVAPGRPAWVIRHDDGTLRAVMLVKDETGGTEHAPGRRVLKVSTFKVDPAASGRALGELLLKTLFAHVAAGRYDVVYTTVYPKHEQLVGLLREFGFVETVPPADPAGELTMVKRLRPVDPSESDPLRAHRRYGPPYVHPDAALFVVPLRPAWHDVLFPELDTALPLWAGRHSYGNALRKAYVSGSGTRRVKAGDALLFYRSDDARAVSVIGVVEDVLVSADVDQVRRFVGRRTVYSPGDLASMATRHDRLHTVVFRQDRLLEVPWTFAALKDAGALQAAPQSITEVREEGRAWVRQQLDASQ